MSFFYFICCRMKNKSHRSLVMCGGDYRNKLHHRDLFSCCLNGGRRLRGGRNSIASRAFTHFLMTFPFLQSERFLRSLRPPCEEREVCVSINSHLRKVKQNLLGLENSQSISWERAALGLQQFLSSFLTLKNTEKSKTIYVT